MSTAKHTIRCPHCEKQFEFLMLSATKEEAEQLKNAYNEVMQKAKAKPAKLVPRRVSSTSERLDGK